MKRIVLMQLFIIFSFFIFGEDIHEYKQIEVYKIKKGEIEGEIGYDSRRSQMGAPPGATALTIDNTGFIYVCDSINNRINIYDSNFKFIREIKSDQNYSVSFSYVIRIDANKNIILINGEMSLLKLNNKGNLLFRIRNNDLVSDITSSYNFFPYEDNILFYDSKSNEKIKFYDPKGQIVDVIRSREIISKNNNTVLSKVFDPISDIQSKIENIVKRKNILIEGVPLTVDFNMHREYYKALEGVQFNTSNKRYIIQKKVQDVEIDLARIGKQPQFIGFDADKNSYWKCDVKGSLILKVILILSPYGEILDAFYNNIKWSLIAVAPSGDVYFLSDMIDTESVYFYKTDRVW